MNTAKENRIDVAWHDTDIAIVSLVGEHDLATADELENQLAGLVRSKEAVIVDVSPSEFIDSSVLNTLVRCDELARKHGTHLTLLVPKASPVRKLLEITGLDALFVVAPSREQAIEAARNPTASTDNLET